MISLFYFTARILSLRGLNLTKTYRCSIFSGRSCFFRDVICGRVLTELETPGGTKACSPQRIGLGPLKLIRPLPFLLLKKWKLEGHNTTPPTGDSTPFGNPPSEYMRKNRICPWPRPQKLTIAQRPGVTLFPFWATYQEKREKFMGGARTGLRGSVWGLRLMVQATGLFV